jgi:hypothetical protein
MATLPGDNSSISFAEIQAEFARGTDLNAYRGTSWFTDSNTSGTFPNSPISFADFRSKRKTSPVTNLNRVITADEVFTVPLFNTLTITVRGAGGGGGGFRGSPFGTAGTAGSAGAATSFGDYATAYGGGGGTYGAKGADGAGADGGAAGGNGDGPGGNGGKVVLTWVASKASDKAHIGEKIAIKIGAGGAPGAGGPNFGANQFGWFALGFNANGAAGAKGSVTIEVT